MDDGNILVYSGVPQNEKAKGGVPVLINKEHESFIQNWKRMSERILVVQLQQGMQSLTVITLYGPNEADKLDLFEKNEEQERITTTK